MDGGALGKVVAILIGSILMFGLPSLAIAQRNDDVAQLKVQTAVAEFVNTVRTKGKITTDDYDMLIAELNSTGNTFETQIEVQVIDENARKKTGTDVDKIGENNYYSIYTTQIMQDLSETEPFLMKEGDIVSVKVSNTNNTIAQMFKNFFYGLSGNDTYSIIASHSGIVTATGRAS